MTNTKMSDVFDLPLVTDGEWVLQANNSRELIECNYDEDAEAVTLAVNSHDKLVEVLEVVEVYMKDNAERMTELKDMRMRLMVIQALQAIKGEQE